MIDQKNITDKIKVLLGYCGKNFNMRDFKYSPEQLLNWFPNMIFDGVEKCILIYDFIYLFFEEPER